MNTQEKIKELEAQLQQEKLEEMKKHPLFGKKVRCTYESSDLICIGTVTKIEPHFQGVFSLFTGNHLIGFSDKCEILEDK